MTERYTRIYEIYIHAHGIDDDAIRATYLDDACGDDETLRNEVESLLRQGRDEPLPRVLADTEIDRQRAAAEAHLADPDHTVFATGTGPGGAPAQIGSYRIIREIGRGGMGAVYEAEQESPKRTVALKIINAGIISPELLRRFQYEAEVLGRLQHPGIAQIHEAGTFDTGRGAQPFFAMEYIQGQSLTTYCDAQHLGTRQRLELLAKISDAVHHAHQRGVIHRDLKPGNILVDASDQPKILDFGIARTTDSDIHTTTLRTDIGQLIGTIPYMSPEQAAGDPDDLDTRSDVYALGVIAYELIGGRLPYDVREKMVHEAVRVIREDDPTPLSSIDRTFRGDIETIIGTALAKEKDRRYQSALSFAEDLRRYLNDEPITARPPSTWYNLRKFTQRNKALVGGVVATMLALIIGLMTSTTYYRQAETARIASVASSEELRHANNVLIDAVAYLDPADLALALTTAWEKQLRETLSQEDRSPEDIRSTIETLRASIDKTVPQEVGRTVLKGQFLDPLREKVDEGLEAFPHARAHLLTAIAHNYSQIGYLHEACDLQQQVLNLVEDTRSNRHHLDTQLTLLKYLTAASRFDEALVVIDEIGDPKALLDRGQDEQALAIIHPIAIFLYEQRRNAEAEWYFRTGAELERRFHGAGSIGELAMKTNLAGVLRKQPGKLAEAEREFRDTLALAESKYGATSDMALTLKGNLSMLLVDLDRVDDAENMIRGVLDHAPSVYGRNHWIVGNIRGKLARILAAQGRFDEVEAEIGPAWDLHVRGLGPDHHRTIETAQYAVDIYIAAHEAEPMAEYDQKIVEWQAKLPPVDDSSESPP